MALLILGVLLWYVTHLLPIYAHPTRDGLVARIGEGPWKGLYSIVSLAVIALIVIGYQQAPYTALWTPPGWGVHVNNLLMLLAVVAFYAGMLKSPLAAGIRHPMFIGVILWGVAHLLVNGHLAALILFGGMILWAALGWIGTNRRDGPWAGRGEAKSAIRHLLISVAVFAVVIGVHWWIGVRPVPG